MTPWPSRIRTDTVAEFKSFSLTGWSMGPGWPSSLALGARTGKRVTPHRVRDRRAAQHESCCPHSNLQTRLPQGSPANSADWSAAKSALLWAIRGLGQGHHRHAECGPILTRCSDRTVNLAHKPVSARCCNVMRPSWETVRYRQAPLEGPGFVGVPVDQVDPPASGVHGLKGVGVARRRLPQQGQQAAGGRLGRSVQNDGSNGGVPSALSVWSPVRTARTASFLARWTLRGPLSDRLTRRLLQQRRVRTCQGFQREAPRASAACPSSSDPMPS